MELRLNTSQKLALSEQMVLSAKDTSDEYAGAE